MSKCALLGLASLLLINSGCFRTCNEAEDVAMDEVGPRALLKKYSWLKETSAALDKKLADIQVVEARVKLQEARYAESHTVHDSDNLNQAEVELTGLILSYNDLASRYNAKMSEEHWKFADVGSLPRGATVALPREYKPYITTLNQAK